MAKAMAIAISEMAWHQAWQRNNVESEMAKALMAK
jgi:hypothetical protein